MENDLKKAAGTVGTVLAGNVVLAFTVTAFIVPQGIIMGGATGVGLTIGHYVPLPLSVIVLAVNLTLFVLGAGTLGKKFALTTLVSTFAYPAILSVVQKVPAIGSLTDILALVLHKYTHIPVAVLIYGVDFAVLGCQLSFSDTEQVLYGILTLVTETLVLNRVMVMGASQMQLFVISEAYEEIRQKLIGSLDAGVTMVHIENGYGKTQSRGVLCVVPDRKLFQAKELIQGTDPGAFITISKINEVRGRGFTLERRYRKA